MANIQPKAAYIGPMPIGVHIAKKSVPQWEFVAIEETIEDFENKLNNDEIDNDIQVILIHDSLYDPADEKFEHFSVDFSPYCFYGIVQYNPAYESKIRDKVAQISTQLDGEDGSGELNFIPKDGFRGRLMSRVERYINTHDNDVAAILDGRDPAPTDPLVEEKQREIDENNQRIKEAEEKYEKTEYFGKIISCTSSKGGSGKSSVALLLATYLSHASIQSAKEGLEERPLKVCILDLDTKDGQIGFITGANTPTVLHLQRHGIDKATVEETAIYNDRLKVDLFLAPKKAQNALDIQPGWYQELIAFLRTQYDYVILDTSVNYLDPLLGEVAYPMSDLIVVVTDIVINSVFSMARWIGNVTGPIERGGMGIKKSKIGIVVNKAALDVNMSKEKIEQLAQGVKIIAAIPSHAKLMATAANTQSMDQALRNDHIRAAIKRIARGVAGRDYNLAKNFII